MNLASLKKSATLSALLVALAAMYSDEVMAVSYQLGDPVTVSVTATVENSVDVTIVNGLSFGTIGAVADTTDVASLVIDPDSTPHEDAGDGWLGASQAAIVVDPSSTQPAAATITVTGFDTTTIYVTYSNIDHPTDGTQNFILTDLLDDLAVPGSYDGTTRVNGQGTTDGSGDLTFHIGGTLQTTTAAAVAYADGAYNGSFDVTFSY